MYEDDVKKAEERKRQAEKATADLIRLAELEKQTAAETKKQKSLLDDIKDYATEEKPRAGTIKQLLSPLGVLVPMHPVAEANASGAAPLSNQYLNTFATTWFKQVRDTAATMVTRKDYLGDPEGGKKISKQMGIQGEAAQTATGLMLDMTSDPSNFILWPKSVLKLIKTSGKVGLELASKSPKIEKGIEAIRRRFNLFHDIEKTGTPEEVAEFKQGFTEFAESGDAGTLTRLGYDLKKYVKSKFGSEVKDVSTNTNYKFQGERTITTETPELLKAQEEVVTLQRQLQNAKANEKAVYDQWQTQDSVRAAWKKSPQLESTQLTINQLQNDIKDLTKKAAEFKAADNIVTRKQLTEQITELQTKKNIADKNLIAAKKAKTNDSWNVNKSASKTTDILDLEHKYTTLEKETNLALEKQSDALSKANQGDKTYIDHNQEFTKAYDDLSKNYWNLETKRKKALELLNKAKGTTTTNAKQYDIIINQYSTDITKLKEEIAFLKEQKTALAPANIKKGFDDAIAAKQAELAKYSTQAGNTKPAYVDLTSDATTARNTVANIEKQLAAKEASLSALKAANTNVVKGYDHYYAVLEEAFGDVGESGIFGKTLDTTSGLFKRLMSWSPIFQGRNFMGAVQQNLSEGRGFQAYMDGLGFMTSKGKSNPELYDTLRKSGVYNQPGMYEQPMSRLPGRIAAKGEELNRVVSILDDIKKNGLTAQEAIANSQRIFYKYNDAYFTKFEKAFMKRIDPFYAYDKQNLGYFSEAIFNNSPFWNAMNKIKQGTKPDDEKEFPYLERDYRKDQFSIGSWGNFGSQGEDAFKMFTLDWKSAYSKTAPLIKAVVEGTFDYNIFKGVQISKDNKAGQVEHLPELFRKAYGYNDEDKTINPWMGWGVNKVLGPLEKPILNAWDTDKDLSSVFTSTRQYKTDKASLAQQQYMQDRSDKNGGFLENNRFSGIFDLGLGPAMATADTSANTKATIDNTKAVTEYSKYILKWATRNTTTPDKFAKEYQFSGGYEQTMFYNQSQKWGRDRADALQYSGDIAEGDQKAHEQRLGNLKAENEFYHRSMTDSDQALLELNLKFDKTRVRKMGEAQVFSAKELTTYTTLGLNAYQIAFNRIQEKFVAGQSKLGETWRQSSDSSPQSIYRTAESEKKSALAQAASGGLGEEWLTNMLAAIKAKQDHALNELEARNRAAIANIIDNWADAEADGFAKIERKRQAAQERYYSTDDYKNAKARNDYVQINEAKIAIDAKFDQQRREELVKQTKAHMEEVEKITKGRAENIIAALKDIYKRGGMGIKEYYGKELEQHSSQYTEKAQQALNVSEAVMASATNNNKPTVENYGIDYTVQPISEENRKKFNVGYGVTPTSMMIQKVTEQIEDVIKTSKTLEEFKKKINDIGASSYGLDVKLTLDPTRKIVQKVTEELDILRGIISDPDLDVETRVEAMNSALELMQKKLKGIDPIAMKVAIDGMADAANGLAKSANEAASGIIDDTTKFNLAVAQIQEENSKLRAQIYSQTGYKTPGISSMSEKGGIVFGRKTSPYMPVGFNPIQEELKANQGATDAQFYDKMQKTQALPADGEPITLSQKTPDMDWTSYYQTIEAQLAEHEANKEQLTKQGKEKLQLLQDDYATYLAKSNANVIEADKKAFNLRMQTASDMAGMMGQTASMLYEASGKKSKEAFYVMKAMAFAEAAIKGYQAIMTAYASGQAAGAPYAGAAVGAAYAAIASAFVGVQLGLIASQTIQGPGKAEGGPIEGGTGHKDDVPIMAMGGEYIIRRSSTKKYGASFLDALNKGLIPVNELNFSVPNAPAPNYGQTHFAEGGQAMASNINTQKQQDTPAQDIQIVNVIDPGLLDKYLASHAGQRTLVNVLASNKYELQQVMR